MAIPIRGVSHGSPGAAFETAKRRGAQRLDFLLDYAKCLWADSAVVNVRADVLWAQWDLETGSGTSAYWNRDGNPAGLAAFDDGSNWGLTFSPQKAARAHVVHMLAYLGMDPPDGWKEADARWQAVIDAGYFGSVDTTSDLGNGRWGTDPNYAGKLASRHAAYNFAPPVSAPSQPSPPKEPPVALNFDPALVPFPPYEHRWALNKKDGVGQDNLGQRVHRGIAWHRGVTGGQSLDSAVSYLISPNVAGLTDGYIDNQTGRVVMMNPMKSMFSDLPSWWEDRAGWANGPYRSANASEDGKAFVAAYGARLGANIVNQDLESFEILGNYDTGISAKCKQVIAQIQANRAQRKKIPWDSYPINPATGLTEIYGHREFCGTGYKLCPGAVVWDFINGEGVEMTRAILKAAQTKGSTAPAPTPTPTPPPPTTPQPDINLLAELFGGADGFAYDPNGVITATWLAEGEKTGEFPRLIDTITEGKVRNFVFSNGMVLQNEIGTGKVARMTQAA